MDEPRFGPNVLRLIATLDASVVCSLLDAGDIEAAAAIHERYVVSELMLHAYPLAPAAEGENTDAEVRPPRPPLRRGGASTAR